VGTGHVLDRQPRRVEDGHPFDSLAAGTLAENDLTQFRVDVVLVEDALAPRDVDLSRMGTLLEVVDDDGRVQQYVVRDLVFPGGVGPDGVDVRVRTDAVDDGVLDRRYRRQDVTGRRLLDGAPAHVEAVVEPSLEGAQSGNYPLARPLFTYGHMGKIQEKNHLQEFIRYYINEADEDYIAESIGYVPASEQMVEDNLTALEEAIAGEYEYSA